MLPDLVAVLMEEASDVRVMGFNVDFACANDVGVDGTHVAEVVEDV